MRPVFVGGCDRSGTTLLGSMLGRHPDVLCVPEFPSKTIILRNWERIRATVTASNVIDWLAAQHSFMAKWAIQLNKEKLSTPPVDYRGLTEWVVSQFGDSIGKPSPEIWVDHTPSNIRMVSRLVEQFPDACFLHIVRDGRAVANSLLELPWGPGSIDHAAVYWMQETAPGLAAEIRFGQKRIMRVHYESLIMDAESTLQAICTNIGLDYDGQMALGGGFKPTRYHQKQHHLVDKPPDPSRISSWKAKLSPRDIEVFEHLTGDMLDYFGYEMLYSTSARPLNRRERWANSWKELSKRALMRYRHNQRMKSALAANHCQEITNL